MKEKPKSIKLKYGCVRKLASELKCSPSSIWEAITFHHDSDLMEAIRKKAYDNGYVRRF